MSTRSQLDLARSTRDEIRDEGHMTPATYDLMTLIISALEQALPSMSQQRETVDEDDGIELSGALDMMTAGVMEFLFKFAAAFDVAQDIQEGRHAEKYSFLAADNDNTADPVVH